MKHDAYAHRHHYGSHRLRVQLCCLRCRRADCRPCGGCTGPAGPLGAVAAIHSTEITEILRRAHRDYAGERRSDCRISAHRLAGRWMARGRDGYFTNDCLRIPGGCTSQGRGRNRYGCLSIFFSVIQFNLGRVAAKEGIMPQTVAEVLGLVTSFLDSLGLLPFIGGLILIIVAVAAIRYLAK